MKKNKEKFIKLLKLTKREGINNLINWLENESDFFIAPASTKYHLSKEGGLLEHSLNVYENLLDEISIQSKNFNKDSLIIVSLLHDICKANYYLLSEKNVKKNNEWVKESYYTIDDQHPLGHGEKSVIIIQKYIKLTEEEIIAIRWHMGGYESKDNYNYLSKAFSKYPLAVILHIADLKSTYLSENN